MDIYEIESRARDIRNTYKISSYGIKDIFSLVEQMGIYLIRYPIGKNVLCGFCTVSEGKKILVSNSSEILPREIYTIAHEIGHLQYDFDEYTQDIKIDKDFGDIESNFIESRADYFAAALLMPKTQIEEYVYEILRKEYNQLKALDVVRIQIEFNVSYAAAVKRLYELKHIDERHKSILFDERNEIKSSTLFKMINADECLLKASEELKVPGNYYEFVLSNYENGYVPFENFSKALSVVGVDANIFKKEETPENEDINLDDIFKEFEEWMFQ